MNLYPVLPAALVPLGVLGSLAVAEGGMFSVLTWLGLGAWTAALGWRLSLWLRWQWRRAAWGWRHGRRVPPGAVAAARIAAEVAGSRAAVHTDGRHGTLLSCGVTAGITLGAEAARRLLAGGRSR